MDTAYHTLHEFMLHTESVTYIIILLALAVITGFWFFLSGEDEE